MSQPKKPAPDHVEGGREWHAAMEHFRNGADSIEMPGYQPVAIVVGIAYVGKFTSEVRFLGLSDLKMQGPPGLHEVRAQNLVQAINDHLAHKYGKVARKGPLA